MDIEHLDELQAVEQDYWWHTAKRALVVEVLQRHFPPPRRLVEGGIGAGGNLKALQICGYQVSGFDIIPQAVRYCRDKGLEDVRVHDLQQPWPVKPRSLDVVVMLDVLEHMSDPVRVLGHAAQALKGDGGILVTVPACPYLLGPWDRMLGHYRRYTAHLLQRHAREAGLRISWCSHWNAFTYPAALVVRTFERFFHKERTAEFPAVSRPLNSLLRTCARLERGILQRFPLPLGLSLIGVMAHEHSAFCAAKKAA